jgi:hypothetical protein
LHRWETIGGGDASLEPNDKQFRRSLKTKDRKLTERRLPELREKVCGLTAGDAEKVSFEDWGLAHVS